MNAAKLNKFRARMLEELSELECQDGLGVEGQKTVTLDQQSVGRLSRMDALQQQAMAKATQGRRDVARNRISLALTRIDQGEFGYCSECGDEISVKRLELDPTVPRCISCANG